MTIPMMTKMSMMMTHEETFDAICARYSNSLRLNETQMKTLGYANLAQAVHNCPHESRKGLQRPLIVHLLPSPGGQSGRVSWAFIEVEHRSARFVKSSKNGSMPDEEQHRSFMGSLL
jgi:hypothetical protein